VLIKGTKRSMNTPDFSHLLSFFQVAEKLKTELRHSYTTDTNRKESVAEHSWMVGLMAVVLFHEIDTRVDRLKVLKMLIIHDLAEAITGDIPLHEVSTRRENKHAAELAAVQEIVSLLPDKSGKEIMELWNEFEARETPEARFAVSLDKLEVVMQHNFADITTWEAGDYKISLNYKDDLFQFDNKMLALKKTIDSQTTQKVQQAYDKNEIKPLYLEIVNDATIKIDTGS
jgi:putative hydrolase of HD superfamily